MTKLRIHLIRHGEKKLFLPDPALTELGVSQAEKLAQRLNKEQQEQQRQQAQHQSAVKTQRLILTSPKKRTRQTAAILAQELGLKVQVDDFLDIDNVLPNTPANKKKIIDHFQQYLNLREIDDKAIELLEILAVTHSQEIKNFWRILGGPEKAIADVYECGVWSIEVEANELDEDNGLEFEWTEGDLNP
ncbi:MAG TPA: histidine phosphatase family protein [Candidatus Woesebacteria bacterium]|nr:histidine phosphatase family protein [Candidatus Woesebacteria bacterium]HPR14002.1 histidine phosphatase family protein [Candidatus Woesebacteria bacterium]